MYRHETGFLFFFLFSFYTPPNLHLDQTKPNNNIMGMRVRLDANQNSQTDGVHSSSMLDMHKSWFVRSDGAFWRLFWKKV